MIYIVIKNGTPAKTLLLILSLIPLSVFFLFQLAQLRRSEIRSRTPQRLPAVNRDFDRHATVRPNAAGDPATPESAAASAGDEFERQGPDDDALVAADDPRSEDSSRPLSLSRLLRAPREYLETELQLGCQFVRTIQPDSTWRLGSPQGKVQRPSCRLVLVDSDGNEVAEGFVVADSQADRAVSWLMEGDSLEIVGNVVIRLDRPSRPPVWGFLIHEIRPATRADESLPSA